MEALELDYQDLRKNFEQLVISIDCSYTKRIAHSDPSVKCDASSSLCKQLEGLHINTISGPTNDSSQANQRERNCQIVSDEITSQFFESCVLISKSDDTNGPFNQDPAEKFKNELMEEDLCEVRPDHYKIVRCCPSLKLFYTFSLEKPRKAFFRTKLVKGHKKFQKNTIRNKVRLISPDLTEKTILSKTKLINHIRENAVTLKMFCLLLKNCNKHDCKLYFSNPVVAESFDYYVAYLFSYSSCDQLSKNFYIKCCTSNIHCDECIKLWRNLEVEMKCYVDAQTSYGRPEELAP